MEWKEMAIYYAKIERYSTDVWGGAKVNEAR